MTPEDYTKTGEILFSEDSLTKLACYGMEFAKKKMAQSGTIAQDVASHGKVFEKYLAYIVFGRIVRLSDAAIKDKVLHAESVRLMTELGETINQKVAKNGTKELKGIDFSDTKMFGVLGQSFDTVDVEDLYTQLTRPDIETIRRLGSVVVAENPKTEQKSSTFTLE